MLPMHETNLEVVPIHVDEMVLVTSTNHRSLAQREIIEPCEIADLPLLYFQRDTALRELLDQYFRVHRIQPRIVMECDSVSPIKPLVQIDFGVSIVPQMAVAAEAERGELHILRLEGQPLQCHVGLMFLRSIYQPRAVRAFIEQCLAA